MFKPPLRHGGKVKRWSNINIEVSPEDTARLRMVCDLLGWTKVDVLKYCFDYVMPFLERRAAAAHNILSAPIPPPPPVKLIDPPTPDDCA